MDIKKGEQLRKEWGNAPCDHPSFTKKVEKVNAMARQINSNNGCKIKTAYQSQDDSS